MNAYYNEIDQYPATWLARLVDAGHIAAGQVDARSIRDVRASDLDGATQAHFFAGLGAWSYALRLAGWPDDRPIWTGSCPCQPFSSAGKRRGFDDERHLWPEWFRLIRECRPPVVFGEQVARGGGLEWFDLVHADLEAEGYAVGAASLAAPGAGAFHIRERLFFVAHAERGRGGARRDGVEDRRAEIELDRHSATSGLAVADRERRHGFDALLRGRGQDEDRVEAAGGRADGGVGDASNSGLERHGRSVHVDEARGRQAASRHGAVPRMADPWRDAEWLPCLDGKARPVEPGTFPLVDGAPARVGRLRAYGNAIVPQVAATFIRAVMESVNA